MEFLKNVQHQHISLHHKVGKIKCGTRFKSYFNQHFLQADSLCLILTCLKDIESYQIFRSLIKDVHFEAF